MNRLIVLAGVLAVAIVASATTVRAEDKDGVKTSAIMKKCFGKNGLCGTCVGQGKKKDWDAAAKTAKEFVKCIESLPKGEPKKGDKADFGKLSKEFVTKVQALESAITAKDDAKFAAASKAVTGSCKACHTAHR